MEDIENIETLAVTVEDEPTVVVEEPTPVAEPEPQPEPEPVPAPVEPPAPMPAANAAVTGDVDEVLLAKCVYENKFERKSLTIHHIQRRLEELGYKDVIGDRDGWLGELTMMSVNQFQQDRGMDVTEKSVDTNTFLAIFAGDPNVNPIV
jgi:peptidoglycan hydrolase-like protein with peptidoglycan-binding domain